METAGVEWTIMTWNLQGAKRTDVDEVARIIGRESPDVIVLQEVRKPQAAKLATDLGMASTWTEKHFLLTPLFSNRAEGAAILTPHKLHSLGDEVVSAKTSKRSYKRRIVQWATVERSDATGYRIYNGHLSPHELATERRSEARRIAEIVASHAESPPAVVAGDFNDHGDPQILATLPGIEHIPSPFTNPAQAPNQALDHVLLPVDARSVSVSTPAGSDYWAALSDHLPVTVRFTLDWVQGGFAS